MGIVVLLPLSKRFLSGNEKKEGSKKSRRKTLSKLMEEYQLADNLSVFTVENGSLAADKTLAELDIHHRYGLTVLEVRRIKKSHTRLMKDVEQKLAGPNTMLTAGDIIYISGNKESAARLAEDLKLNAASSQNLTIYDIGIAEVVLMHSARLCGKSIKDSGVRRMYNVNVLGVQRGGDYITDNLADLKLREGDILLIQGRWKNIARIANEAEGIVRLHTRSAGYGGDDCRSAHGDNRMSAQRGGCLQDDKLGEYCADCGDAAHVGGAGEDGSVEYGGAPACRQPRRCSCRR